MLGTGEWRNAGVGREGLRGGFTSGELGWSEGTGGREGLGGGIGRWGGGAKRRPASN